MMARTDVKLTWMFLLGALALFVVALRALKTGKIMLGNLTFTRSENDSLYWFSVWGCVALGIGAVLLVTAKSVSSRDWMNLIGSVFLVLSGLTGLKTGKTLFIRQRVTRSEDGYLYWFAIGSTLILGAAWLLMVLSHWAHYAFHG